MESVESGWTKENLQKLLAAMKACIPKDKRSTSYRVGLKTIDWNKVTFPPFSPEECQLKWMDFMVKVRKSRSLTELIVEAEDIISDPSHNMKLCKKPTPPSAAYYKKNAAKFKREHPEMSSTQLLKFSDKKFKALPSEKKAKYQEKYSCEVEEYRQQICQQDAKSSSQSIVHRKKRRKVSAYKGNEHCTNNEDGLPIKPPLSGYTLFCKEQYSSIRDVPSVPKNQYIKEWARRWRDLSVAEKEQYIKSSKELKKQYMVKLNSYLERFDEAQQEQILKENGIRSTRLKVKAVKHVTRLQNEPKMPSQSGNVIFCKLQMEHLKDKIPNGKERFIKVNQMWRNLSTKQKEYYKNGVNERMRKYAVELQNWFKTLTPEEQKKYKSSNPRKKLYLTATEVVEEEEEEEEEVNETRPHPCQPSDSEDEMIMISSSDKSILSSEDDMEEEEDEDYMFEM